MTQVTNATAEIDSCVGVSHERIPAVQFSMLITVVSTFSYAQSSILTLLNCIASPELSGRPTSAHCPVAYFASVAIIERSSGSVFAIQN